MDECPEYPGTYTLNIDGFADNHTLGEPALPYIHDIFNIGASSECSVEVLSATYRDYDIAVAPAYGDVYQYEQQRPIQPITATDLATEPIVKKAVMPINQSYNVDQQRGSRLKMYNNKLKHLHYETIIRNGYSSVGGCDSYGSGYR